MDRLKVFDRALLGKQIGGNGIIVIVDTIYIITGPFFCMMQEQDLYRYILFINMFVTCMLYHNFIVSRGDMKLELNTEKIVYYPTTRYRFLLNKYAKTLILLIIQLSLTLACLGLGYFGNRSSIEGSRLLGGVLFAFTGILLASGMAILVMHIMPLGIYLSMLMYFPLLLLTGFYQEVMKRKLYVLDSLWITILLYIFVILLLWFLFLWIGNRIYEKKN